MESIIGLILLISVIATLIFYRRPIIANADFLARKSETVTAEWSIPLVKRNMTTQKEWEKIIQENGGKRPPTGHELLMDMLGENEE